MAHFAKIVDGIVDKVIVADSEYFDTFIDDSPGDWIRTYYEGKSRKQYAGVGYSYNKLRDVFIAPQPYPSWSLDSNDDWQSPTPHPEVTGEELYEWNEDTLSWVEVEQV